MLFDLGMSELLLIGVVALVFIGPKDLPKALRVAGYWVRKARTLSREFQSSVEQMIREAELDEMRQELKKATEIDLDQEFRRTIDPTGSLAESLKPPELPKFFDADPTPVPASKAHMAPAIEAAEAEAAKAEAAKAETIAPATSEITPPHDAPADAPQGEASPHDMAITAAQPPADVGRQDPAVPGLPPARE